MSSLFYSVIFLMSFSTNVYSLNENTTKQGFFDFNDFILRILDDVINKNVIDNIDKTCVQQLNVWRESILVGDFWALKGIDE